MSEVVNNSNKIFPQAARAYRSFHDAISSTGCDAMICFVKDMKADRQAGIFYSQPPAGVLNP